MHRNLITGDCLGDAKNPDQEAFVAKLAAAIPQRPVKTMTNITTVDRLEVLVVVDNVTDSLSTNPNNVQTEWVGLLQRGLVQLLSGKATCCAHHGLSLLITAYIGSEKRTLLFDAGPEGETFLRNAKILGVD